LQRKRLPCTATKNEAEVYGIHMGASKPDAHRLAVFSLLLSATLWGLVWYPLRLLEEAGLQGLWVTLAAYGAALLTAIPVLGRQRHRWREGGLTLLALALASGWCNVTFILAMLDGTVVRVLLLFFLSPLWSVLLGRWLLGEALQGRSLLLLLMALGGALIMLWNPTLGWPWPQQAADWLALASGFGFALTNVLARKLAAVPVGVKTVASWWGVILVALLCLLLTRPELPSVGMGPWFGAVLLGWFGFVVMTLSVLYGVSRLPVQRSAIILPFELVIGAVSAWWLAGETAVLQEWIGGALIVSAAFFSARSKAGLV
jgi:drug/metabolite transporter (DMT)-like permease